MIAYVQEETTSVWSRRIDGWIAGLAADGHPGWTAQDSLQMERDDESLKLTVLRSSHTREANLPLIELRHLWIQMN